MTLSNIKQTGTGMAIYLSDSDDLFPIAVPSNNQTTYYNGLVVPYPYNAVANGGWDAAFAQSIAAQMWTNSISGYLKSKEITTGGPNLFTISGEVFATGVEPGKGGLLMNGLLQTLSTSSVNNPSAAVMFSAFGNTTYKGRTSSNPQPNCGTGTGPCQFNPGGATRSGGSGGSTTYGGLAVAMGLKPWTWGKVAPYVGTDTSAKYRRIAIADWGSNASGPYNEDVWNDPYAYVRIDGTTGNYVGASYGCNIGTGDGWDPNLSVPTYHCFYRPDREK